MKRNLGIIIAVILIVCSLNIFSFASNVKDLANQQEEAKKQKEEADKQLQNVKINLSETMQNIEELHQKIITKEEELKTLNSDIAKVATNIKETEQNLKLAETNYEKQKAMSNARLIAIYEAGKTSYLDVLLKSNSLSDFISNYYLLTEIVQKDTQMLEDLEKEKNIVETAKETLESQKEKLISLRNNSEKNSVLLSNMVVLKNNYINELTEEEKALQEKIDRYDSEIKKLDNEIYALMNLNISYTGGVMLWPAPRIYNNYI